MGTVLAKIIGKTFQNQKARVKEKNAKNVKNDYHNAWLQHMGQDWFKLSNVKKMGKEYRKFL